MGPYVSRLNIAFVKIYLHCVYGALCFEAKCSFCYLVTLKIFRSRKDLNTLNPFVCCDVRWLYTMSNTLASTTWSMENNKLSFILEAAENPEVRWSRHSWMYRWHEYKIYASSEKFSNMKSGKSEKNQENDNLEKLRYWSHWVL